MITGLRSSFEARCRERGYTMEQVRGCIVSEDGDLITVDEAHRDYPRPPAGPSMISKAANFAVAAAQHIASGAPMASYEEIALRADICHSCEFFDGKSCSKCGCPVVREKNYISKLSWADQSCPVGKWGKTSG